MRPTTKDLAKAAGVSLATVDRVLNGRAGVRQETIRVVNEAIERLGFSRNILAANLAKGKNYRFEFLLPLRGDEYRAELIRRIDEAGAAFTDESVSVGWRHIADEDPYEIAGQLSAIDPDDLDGIAIIAPESPQVRDATMRLVERGVNVVRFVSGGRGSDGIDFVGIDNDAAGATAGRLIGKFVSGRAAKVAVITETLNARNSLERRYGFDHLIGAEYPNLRPLPTLETHSDRARTFDIIRTAFASNPEIGAVYIMASEARLPLLALSEIAGAERLIIVAHERTPSTVAALCSGMVDAVIAQDPGHLVRSAIRHLRSRCDGRVVLASQEQIRIEILLKENIILDGGEEPARRQDPAIGRQ